MTARSSALLVLLLVCLACMKPSGDAISAPLTRNAASNVRQLIFEARFEELERVLDTALGEGLLTTGGRSLYAELMASLGESAFYIPQSDRWIAERPKSGLPYIVRANQALAEATFFRGAGLVAPDEVAARKGFEQRLVAASGWLEQARFRWTT